MLPARIILCCLLLPQFCRGQETVFDSLENREPVDINFLFNYYNQDGNHSAVTGGIGTEELKDYATNIQVLIPLDSANKLALDVAANIYTSASTDMIDARMSSASSRDTRSSINFAWDRFRPRSNWTWKAGASVESDYLSLSFGSGWTINGQEENNSFHVSGQVFLDRWILYFPAELRDTIQPTVSTDKRRSYNLNLTYQQIINQRLNASISTDLNWQRGFLSTPFHRVYFQGEILPRIENFPSNRWKLPVGLRLNYFATNHLIFRLFYRYYWDSFNIRAHTFNLEIPLKLHMAWTISPFYRFHRQTAADFFLPFGEHQDGALFYTSDFDLSAFSSQKFGLGLRYIPLWQLSKAEARLQWEISAISLRLSHYRRSDGLKSWSLSTLFSISN